MQSSATPRLDTYVLVAVRLLGVGGGQETLSKKGERETNSRVLDTVFLWVEDRILWITTFEMDLLGNF